MKPDKTSHKKLFEGPCYSKCLKKILEKGGEADDNGDEEPIEIIGKKRSNVVRDELETLLKEPAQINLRPPTLQLSMFLRTTPPSPDQMSPWILRLPSSLKYP